MNVSHLKASVRWEPGSAVLDLQGEINGSSQEALDSMQYQNTELPEVRFHAAMGNGETNTGSKATRGWFNEIVNKPFTNN